MLPCPQGDCFTVKYGRDVHSYIVGTERKGNQKERKKNIEPAAKKKIEHVQNCREGRGKSFALRKMAGSMGSPPLGRSCEGCSEKKAKKWEEAKREYDSIWGTLFNGVRAIAKEHNVAIARLRRYAHRSAKRHHGYDTDSSALGGDSGSDDSGDGDSDGTM